MISSTVLGLVGRAVRSAPLWTLVRDFYRGRATMVFYHGVWSPDDERLGLFGGVAIDRLESELRALAQRFQFVPLDTHLSTAGREADDSPLCTLTFDDGFDLMDERVLELLRRLHISATVFVNTRSVDYLTIMWQHQFAAICATRGAEVFCRQMNEFLKRIGEQRRLRSFADQIAITRDWPTARKEEWTAELWDACDMPPADAFLQRYRPYFDWEGLERWIAHGHSVGLHTASHPFCSRLGEGDLEEEFFSPARLLRERLALDSLPFAYPFGDRLPAELERAVAGRGVFSCLLGTAGLAARGALPEALERAEAEPDVNVELFSRPLVQAVRKRLRQARS